MLSFYKIRLLSVFLFSSVYIFGQASLPKVVSGHIERFENFKSEYVTPRNIDVWLPENYNSKQKYSVLYMHDGQMLFDSEMTWNKQSWEVDEVISKYLDQQAIANVIVVGIWNGGTTRHSDYFPEEPFTNLSKPEQDTITAQLQKSGRTKESFTPQSDNYLKFIVTEVKPYIDQRYSVYTDAQHTYMAGSSMGGLISLYGICKYPEIFGGVACISTHWPGTFTVNNPFPEAFIEYLNNHLPSPKNHKIYFDCGDKTLDALYPPIQQKVDKLMIKKGYSKKQWLTQYFPGEEHSEKSWSKRLAIPLIFLLENKVADKKTK